MHVLIVYRHYWPDTAAYSSLLRSIAERLAADGHTVEVVTSQPSYNDRRLATRPRWEVVGGVRIVRLPLPGERKTFLLSRLFNNAVFLAAAFAWGLLRRRPDVVMTPSMPPAMAGTVGLWLSWCRGCRLLYHCQDLHPEASRRIGRLRAGGLVDRLLMACEKSVHRGADTVVVPSPDMAATVRERGLSGDNIRIINSFVLAEPADGGAAPEGLRRRPGEAFRVLFAGNHGLYQGLEQVIDAAWRLRAQADLHFQFLGDGHAKAQLLERAGGLLGRTVFFHPHVPTGAARRAMEESDLGLVPLAAGIHRLAYPSKTMTLLAAGLPLLVVVEPESDLARFVARERVGWTAPPGDPDALAAAIRLAYAERERRPEMGERSRRAAFAEFGLAATLDRWSDLFRELAARVAGPAAGAGADRALGAVSR